MIPLSLRSLRTSGVPTTRTTLVLSTIHSYKMIIKFDKEETKQFVKDTLKEMADGDDNDEFNEEDFNKCFEEFDKDGSGTIEKDEMALFIKKVAGL